MLIGVDFDNTIVQYGEIFHRAAVERAMIPANVPNGKDSVRNCLRQCGREDDWTELQGYVYGVAIEQASPFEGVIDFFVDCRRCGLEVYIISHRTRYPFRGPAYDLHAAARQWLDRHGFHNRATIALPSDRVFLEETKQGKLNRIAQTGCSHFIDDLPEFLADPGFPRELERILFDPSNRYVHVNEFRRASSWSEISRLILGESRTASR